MDSLTIIREFLDSRLEIAPGRVLPEAKLDDLDVDSLMLADTTVRKEESFLEQLYNRKLRQQRQQEKRDSIRRQDLISIEENDDND